MDRPKCKERKDLLLIPNIWTDRSSNVEVVSVCSLRDCFWNELTNIYWRYHSVFFRLRKTKILWLTTHLLYYSAVSNVLFCVWFLFHSTISFLSKSYLKCLPLSFTPALLVCCFTPPLEPYFLPAKTSWESSIMFCTELPVTHSPPGFISNLQHLLFLWLTCFSITFLFLYLFYPLQQKK